MDVRKIFSIVVLCFIMIAYQNCGSGLLPGQEIDGFQSNGGGYSGIHEHSGQMPSTDYQDEKDETIDINNGQCTGKIMTYHLVSESCQPTNFTELDYSNLLASHQFSLNGEALILPTNEESVCTEFISKYVMVIDACENTIKQVERSSVEYVGTGVTVVIEGLIYKAFGIQKIY